MSRRTIFFLVAAIVLVSAATWNLRQRSETTIENDLERARPRIVSLSPAITETIFAFGADDLLVGRSDYCDFPAKALALPAAGTTLKPDLEALAHLEPTLILGEKNSGTARSHLSAIARSEWLPWLSIDDLQASLRRLGEITGRPQRAAALFDRISAHLSSQPPAKGPKVLLAMAHTPGKMQEILYFRKDSLHGASLHAAGGINAVQRTPRGMPSLALEEVLALDPEMIIILAPNDSLSSEQREALLADWKTLTPLRAVERGRISVLAGRGYYSVGPRLVELTKVLRLQIAQLDEKR